jgi:hypothetical protein
LGELKEEKWQAQSQALPFAQKMGTRTKAEGKAQTAKMMRGIAER